MLPDSGGMNEYDTDSYSEDNDAPANWDNLIPEVVSWFPFLSVPAQVTRTFKSQELLLYVVVVCALAEQLTCGVPQIPFS